MVVTFYIAITPLSGHTSTGWFDARPRKADAGGPTVLHLSHSTASEVVSYMTPPSALMAHYPRLPEGPQLVDSTECEVLSRRTSLGQGLQSRPSWRN